MSKKVTMIVSPLGVVVICLSLIFTGSFIGWLIGKLIELALK